MFCNKCGCELKENDLFCINCGNKVEYNTNEATVEKDFDEINDLSISVEMLKQGDQRGFTEIYSQTYGFVYLRAKYILKDDDEAQDLAQNVYISLYKNIDAIRNNNGLYGWLKTTIFRQGLNLIRKNQKTVVLSEDAELMFDQLPDENTDIEKAYGTQEDLTFVKECIDMLSEEQKIVVLAYYYDNMKVKEIADILEVSEGTVKSRLYLARKRLEEIMLKQEEKQGYKFYGAAIPALMFAFDDMFDSNIQLPNEIISENYLDICGELQIEAEQILRESNNVIELQESVEVVEEMASSDTDVLDEVNSSGFGLWERIINLGVKKIALATAGVVVAGGLAGGIIANQHKDAAEVLVEETVVEESFTEDEFAGQILPALELVDSCEAMLYGAEIDHYTSYTAFYSNMEDAEDADLNKCVLFEDIDYPEEYAEYYVTEYIMGYYPVYNFNSTEEVNKNLHLYLSDNFISKMNYEKLILDQFTTYENQLYYVQGWVGYIGKYDMNSVEHVKIEDGKLYFHIDYLLEEEYDHTKMVEFVREKGRWVINDWNKVIL